MYVLLIRYVWGRPLVNHFAPQRMFSLVWYEMRKIDQFNKMLQKKTYLRSRFTFHLDGSAAYGQTVSRQDD
jgi:hypothetical protein